MYDNSDNLIGFKLNGIAYYYKKNNLEDILGIYDSNYNLVVRYEYDSWGNCVTYNSDNVIITDKNHVGLLNPYRYRSYYYDMDLEMYWLQSRYYSPMLCRFINIDCQINNDILGDNLYVYCGNNPINRSDNSGKGFFSRIIGGAIVGAVISTTLKVASNIVMKKKWYEGAIGAAVSGAVAGAIVAAPLSKKIKSKATQKLIKTIVAPAVGSFLGSAANEVISYTPAAKLSGITWKEATLKNIKESTKAVAVDTAISTTTSIAGGVFGDFMGDVLHLSTVGRPAEKIFSCFFSSRSIQANTIDFISSTYSEFVGTYLGYVMDYTQHSLYDLFGW